PSHLFDGQGCPSQRDSQDGCPTAPAVTSAVEQASLPVTFPQASLPVGPSHLFDGQRCPSQRDSQDGCPTAPAVTSAVEQASLPVGPSHLFDGQRCPSQRDSQDGCPTLGTPLRLEWCRRHSTIE